MTKIKKEKESKNNLKIDEDSSKPNAKKCVDKAIEKEELRKASRKKRNKWAIKITIITFLLSIAFSFISEMTTSNASITISILLLVLLIVTNIIFDSIGVAATSCDLAPLLSMAARKEKGSKIAVKLVKNAEKVSNICADVIGDICGIVSGACAVAIVIKISISNPNANFWVNIIFSSIIAGITVGGKAFLKEIALRKSKDLILITAKFLSIFIKDK